MIEPNSETASYPILKAIFEMHYGLGLGKLSKCIHFLLYHM